MPIISVSVSDLVSRMSIQECIEMAKACNLKIESLKGSSLTHEEKTILRDKGKIEAIKHVRYTRNLSLRAAYDLVSYHSGI